jgi:DNA replicative helicase MCM subunit Mcm2 (Cdc46/Mcm family)
MVGDPSTAKSQFLRHILNISPNWINITGKDSFRSW